MSKGINQIKLMGNLGADPVTTIFPGGAKSVKISLATNSYWKCSYTGENRSKTQWHTIHLKQRVAEIAESNLSRGDLVYVTGEIRSRKYTDSQNIEHKVTEVIGRKLLIVKKSSSLNTASSRPIDEDSLKPATDHHQDQAGLNTPLEQAAKTDHISKGDGNQAAANMTDHEVVGNTDKDQDNSQASVQDSNQEDSTTSVQDNKVEAQQSGDPSIEAIDPSNESDDSDELEAINPLDEGIDPSDPSDDPDDPDELMVAEDAISDDDFFDDWFNNPTTQTQDDIQTESLFAAQDNDSNSLNHQLEEAAEEDEKMPIQNLPDWLMP